MSRWLLVLVASGAAGCYRVPDDSCAIVCGVAAPCPNGLTCGADNLCTSGTPCGGTTVDGSSDAPISIDGAQCYGAGLVVYCPSMIPPAASLAPVNELLVDTGDPAVGCTDIITAGTVEICVIAADALRVVGRVRAIGRRPLLLFGRTMLDVHGVVDVSSGGAGPGPDDCASLDGKDQPNNAMSAGGGAGGSFIGIGGQGGAANDGLHAPPRATTAQPLVEVRGGCGGGPGGTDWLGMGSGAAGSPGGAVYVLSGGTITIYGTINASGGGGGGGVSGGSTQRTGGGGGGSGGLIVLEAPGIALAAGAVLLAQGGGGGGGSSSGVDGGPGSSPNVLQPASYADGGLGGGTGSGTGGAGSGGSVLAGEVGEDAMLGGSGGGGGGGAGLIKSTTLWMNAGASVFPPPP